MTENMGTGGGEQKKCWASYSPSTTATLERAERLIEKGKLSEAHQVLEPIVKDGNAQAEYMAAGISKIGEVLEDFERRRIDLLQSSAAKDYPPALYALGASLDGVGDDWSRKEAARLFRRAAMQGHAHSQWIYGVDLLYGSNGIEKDELLGVKHISDSANAGFVGALRTMADILENGKFGVSRDSARAAHFRSLAQNSNVIDY